MEPCPHRPPCPGCPRFGATGISSDALDVLRSLCTTAGIELSPVVESTAVGYRHRARLAVRGRARSPKLGIFATNSHDIVDIPRCVVHHTAINDIAAVIKGAIRTTGITPYVDETHQGHLRYIQLVVERRSGTVQVVLVGNDVTPRPLAPLADALTTQLGPRLHSLWWNGQPERTNAILGPHWHRWSGPDAVQETIGGATVFFPPGAFGQSHLELADRIVTQVHAWVPDDCHVVELYAGCGPIGLGLAERSRSVRFNEAAPGGLAGLQFGLDALPTTVRARTSVHPGPAATHAALLNDADVVLADPPRKGLDPLIIETLVRHPPARFIAVSCDLAAFQREARELQDSGRLRLSALVPFALFPHTDHVETVALFERT